MPGPVNASWPDREATPGAVRTETIRAVRSIRARSRLPREDPSDRPPRGTSSILMHIMRDLEMTLMAISQSLAEGVDHTTGGKRKSP